MASMNTRLNIKKLDGNIVQKHGGSKQVGLKQLGSKQVGFKQLGQKQVGFKQLGPGVETGFHGVQDEKRLELGWTDKQPEREDNTDYFGKVLKQKGNFVLRWGNNYRLPGHRGVQRVMLLNRERVRNLI
ncbi:hypothetical protein Tco_0697032 [Tanacetum coccineum]